LQTKGQPNWRKNQASGEEKGEVGGTRAPTLWVPKKEKVQDASPVGLAGGPNQKPTSWHTETVRKKGKKTSKTLAQRGRAIVDM